MKTVHERLAWARSQAGFDDASAAARELDVPEPTYRSHENGTRTPGEKTLRRYAKRFGINWAWIMTGNGDPKDIAHQQRLQAVEIEREDPEKAELLRGLANLRAILENGLEVAPIGGTGYAMALNAAEGLVGILRRLREIDEDRRSDPSSTSAS